MLIITDTTKDVRPHDADLAERLRDAAEGWREGDQLGYMLC